LFGTNNIDAVGFHMKDKYFEAHEPKEVECLCTLSQNYFRGILNTQLELIDFIEGGNKTNTEPLTPETQNLEQFLIFSC
jgi:hypothetical protein